MKIAIVSDLHLGDSQCALVDKNTRTLTDLHKKFKESVGDGNDFLVMAGDILDFSVSRYKDTYECARVFFEDIKKENIAKEIIYLPGNHDSNVWHTVEHETNIINRMSPDKEVRSFRHSVPAILDSRKEDPWDWLHLHGVTPGEKGEGAKYGGLYLDKMVDGEPFFNVAHPNLYLVTDKGCTLVTHGHFFQRYWTFASWLALRAVRGDLDLADKNTDLPGEIPGMPPLSVGELAGMNFPLVQLLCTGVGQSGPLSAAANDIQKDVKSGELKLVRRYLDNLRRYFDDKCDHEGFKGWLRFLNVKEKVEDWAMRKAEKKILEYVSKIAEDEGGDTRFNSEFCKKEEVRKRMVNFYHSSLIELAIIAEHGDAGIGTIPDPERIIFGHTHIPGPWFNDKVIPDLQESHTGRGPVELLNCGGWLRDEQDVFHGANVFKYDSDNPAAQDFQPLMVKGP